MHTQYYLSSESLVMRVIKLKDYSASEEFMVGGRNFPVNDSLVINKYIKKEFLDQLPDIPDC